MGSAQSPDDRRSRSRRRRETVLASARSSPLFRSTQEIYAELRAAGESVGLSTVYRHLQALAEEGVLDTLQTKDGELLYRSCRSDGHHHHLVCEQCGRTAEIEGSPEVESWIEQAAIEHGYTKVSHTFEMLGLCSACRSRQGEAQESGSPSQTDR